MKVSRFSFKNFWSYVTSVLASVFLVSAFVFGSTTISTNISTDGNISVTGTGTFTGLATFDGGISVDNSTSTITNLVTVNATSTSATSTAFYVSGSMIVNGASSTIQALVLGSATSTNATTTNSYVSGFERIATTTPSLSSVLNVQGNAFFSGNITNVANIYATGTIGVATTSSSAEISANSTSATTTLYLTTSAANKGSCIEMVNPLGVVVRIYASTTTSGKTDLTVEAGSCK